MFCLAPPLPCLARKCLAPALLLIFGIGRGVPILTAAASLQWLRRLRWLIPAGQWLQRTAGWLLLVTAAVYLVQAALLASGRPALFA